MIGIFGHRNNPIADVIILHRKGAFSVRLVRERMDKVLLMLLERGLGDQRLPNALTGSDRICSGHRIEQDGANVVAVVGAIEVILVQEGQGGLAIRQGRRVSLYKTAWRSRDNAQEERHRKCLNVQEETHSSRKPEDRLAWQPWLLLLA